MSESKIVDLEEVRAVDAQASLLMKEGIRKMEQPDPVVAREALELFEQALAMRLRLPFEDDSTLRYGLSACWLNRAEALLHTRDVGHLAEALRSYDEGLEVLRPLPLAEDSRFARRLVIAYQNRGLVLQILDHGRVPDAIASFTNALTVLDLEQAADIPDRTYLQAAVWLNLANAHALDTRIDATEPARQAAHRALSLIADAEHDDVDAADVGLKARHVLCQTLAMRLGQPGGAQADDVHGATDAVDEGLELVCGWEQRGETRFRSIAHDLFRFGARVYAAYQPHFVGEFIDDALDAKRSSAAFVESVEMQSAADDIRTYLSGGTAEA